MIQSSKCTHEYMMKNQSLSYYYFPTTQFPSFSCESFQRFSVYVHVCVCECACVYKLFLHVCCHNLYTLLYLAFFKTSLLEYNCFTMVCYFLLYNKVNQLYIYICSHISSLLRLPASNPPYPTALGGPKPPSWSPCAMWLLPTSYLFYV